MVKLANTQDLSFCAIRLVGSSPTASTTQQFMWVLLLRVITENWGEYISIARMKYTRATNVVEK